MPPAQPMVISPSSSESRFSRYLPFSSSAFKPNAPAKPVSSSRVMSTSIGPCSTVSSSIIAIAAATPMPSSAPRVVSRAVTHSPSI